MENIKFFLKNFLPFYAYDFHKNKITPKIRNKKVTKILMPQKVKSTNTNIQKKLIYANIQYLRFQILINIFIFN